MDGYCDNESDVYEFAPKTKKHEVTIYTDTGLSIIEQGEPVPLEAGLEIKTKHAAAHIEFKHVAPQLWTTQTPNLARAFHRDDVFVEAYEHNVATNLPFAFGSPTCLDD